MALLNTDLLSAHDQTFRQDRYMHESWLQEGVVDPGDYLVTPGGASLQWSVAAGRAWVKGDDTTRQGLYQQINDAAVTGTVAAGHATLPRVDAVILSVKDSSVTGVSDTPTLTTLAGTATSGAQVTNFAGANYRAGAAAIPNTAFHICDIAVPATHSGVLTSGMIVDRRKYATRALAVASRTAGNATSASTTDVQLFASDLQRRVECATGFLRVRLSGYITMAAAAYSAIFSLGVDAVVQQERQETNPTAVAASHWIDMVWDVTVTPGSHLFVPYYRGNAASTTTFVANATSPMMFSIEELPSITRSNGIV